VRNVGCLQSFDLIFWQLYFEGGQGVSQVLGFGDADNGRGDIRVLQYPGQGHLGAGQASLLCDLGHDFDHLAIGLDCRSIEMVAKKVIGGALGGGIPVPGRGTGAAFPVPPPG
jgi:hypothetical protein